MWVLDHTRDRGAIIVAKTSSRAVRREGVELARMKALHCDATLARFPGVGQQEGAEFCREDRELHRA